MKELLIVPDWPAPESVTAVTASRGPRDCADGAAWLPAGVELPRLRQVHGKTVADADKAQGTEADAVITARAGIACAVATADCLPLLVCNRAGTEIAAIHAGWRGLAAGIVEATLLRLDSEPADLLVWLGPAISAAHYEVGGEVREQLLAATAAVLREAVTQCFQARKNGNYRADLPGIARAQLAQLGCREVYSDGDCSYADAARFPSFRRDGEVSGRMLSAICIRP